MIHKSLAPFILCAVSVVMLPSGAHAYIDPGTGSYFIQMLIAGLLGGLFAIKIFWHKIKDFFANMFRRKKDDN